MLSFLLNTKGNNDIIDITPQVAEKVKESGIKDGICLISCSGSTCGITTIEYEPNLIEDFKEFLEKLAPADKDYRHDKTWSTRNASLAMADGGEKNGQSHLLSALFKPFLTVAIKNGELLLGAWQHIVLCDFDSRPRERIINIKILK